MRSYQFMSNREAAMSIDRDVSPCARLGHTSARPRPPQARLTQGILLKKIVESIRDLVSEGNLDCNEQGISLQVEDPPANRLSPIIAFDRTHSGRFSCASPCSSIHPACFVFIFTSLLVQAMDSSHVSLCALVLRSDGFDHYVSFFSRLCTTTASR